MTDPAGLFGFCVCVLQDVARICLVSTHPFQPFLFAKVKCREGFRLFVATLIQYSNLCTYGIHLSGFVERVFLHGWVSTRGIHWIYCALVCLFSFFYDFFPKSMARCSVGKPSTTEFLCDEKKWSSFLGRWALYPMAARYLAAQLDQRWGVFESTNKAGMVKWCLGWMEHVHHSARFVGKKHSFLQVFSQTQTLRFWVIDIVGKHQFCLSTISAVEMCDLLWFRVCWWTHPSLDETGMFSGAAFEVGVKLCSIICQWYWKIIKPYNILQLHTTTVFLFG